MNQRQTKLRGTRQGNNDAVGKSWFWQEAAKTPPDPHVGGRWVGGLEAASRICGSNNKELGVIIEPNGQKSTFYRPNKERNVLL